VLITPVYNDITWTNAKSYYVTIIGFVILELAMVLLYVCTAIRDRCCCGRERRTKVRLPSYYTKSEVMHDVKT
jgi:hypothetical protein